MLGVLVPHAAGDLSLPRQARVRRSLRFVGAREGASSFACGQPLAIQVFVSIAGLAGPRIAASRAEQDCALPRLPTGSGVPAIAAGDHLVAMQQVLACESVRGGSNMERYQGCMIHDVSHVSVVTLVLCSLSGLFRTGSVVSFDMHVMLARNRTQQSGQVC